MNEYIMINKSHLLDVCITGCKAEPALYSLARAGSLCSYNFKNFSLAASGGGSHL